jgi:hypothetical protein
MMSLFERRRIAEALAHNTVGQLPHPRDRAPVVKLKQVRVMALGPHFYVPGGSVAIEGEIYLMEADAANSVIARGLAERCN